jgi:hypothetical protein
MGVQRWTQLDSHRVQRLRGSPIKRGSFASLGGESISPPIGKTATLATLEDGCSALSIGHVAGVVAQIELGTVAAKVSLAHVVIGADHAALEDGEEVFSGIGVLEAAGGDVFLGRVIDAAVTVELAAHAEIDRAVVGHEVAGAVDIGHDQRTNVLGIDVGDMERTGAAFALDQCDNGFLGGGLASGAVLGLAADIGFIGFHDLVSAAKGTSRSRTVHCFADAVAEEPSGLVGNAEHTLHLLGAHALLGRGHDVSGEQPLVQRNVRTLHDSASADGELVAAVIAEEHTGLGLARHAADANRTTVRADRLAIGPARSFDMGQCLGFVVEDRIGDIHGGFPC